MTLHTAIKRAISLHSSTGKLHFVLIDYNQYDEIDYVVANLYDLDTYYQHTPDSHIKYCSSDAF